MEKKRAAMCQLKDAIESYRTHLEIAWSFKLHLMKQYCLVLMLLKPSYYGKEIAKVAARSFEICKTDEDFSQIFSISCVVVFAQSFSENGKQVTRSNVEKLEDMAEKTKSPEHIMSVLALQVFYSAYYMESVPQQVDFVTRARDYYRDEFEQLFFPISLSLESYLITFEHWAHVISGNFEAAKTTMDRFEVLLHEKKDYGVLLWKRFDQMQAQGLPFFKPEESEEILRTQPISPLWKKFIKLSLICYKIETSTSEKEKREAAKELFEIFHYMKDKFGSNIDHIAGHAILNSLLNAELFDLVLQMLETLTNLEWKGLMGPDFLRIKAQAIIGKAHVDRLRNGRFLTRIFKAQELLKQALIKASSSGHILALLYSSVAMLELVLLVDPSSFSAFQAAGILRNCLRFCKGHLPLIDKAHRLLSQLIPSSPFD